MIKITVGKDQAVWSKQKACPFVGEPFGMVDRFETNYRCNLGKEKNFTTCFGLDNKNCPVMKYGKIEVEI